MIKSPITSIIGLLVALCPIVSGIWPEAKEVCDKLIAELIGLGFIAASDGIKLPSASAVKTSIAALFTSLVLVGSLVACSQLQDIKARAIEAVDMVSSAIEDIKEVAIDYTNLDCKGEETPETHGCEYR